MRKWFPSMLVGALTAALALSAATASASTSSTLYTSLPKPGVVSVPSLGVEAYSFNQIGNEVILTRSATTRHVSVTMVDWACQHGSWNGGDCVTTAGKTFPTTITLRLYKASHRDPATGEVKPGTQITHVTKTFAIKYRPSSTTACPLENGVPTQFLGSDEQCHHGLDQTIVFDVGRKLPVDVVWGVSYNSSTSGFHPTGIAGPQDSLNVGLSAKTRIGLARYEDSIFWDTRVQGFSCADPTNGNGGPFVTGEFNKDGSCDGKANSWAGYVPAAKFATS
jgi:hypothetical protein